MVIRAITGHYIFHTEVRHHNHTRDQRLRGEPHHDQGRQKDGRAGQDDVKECREQGRVGGAGRKALLRYRRGVSGDKLGVYKWAFEQARSAGEGRGGGGKSGGQGRIDGIRHASKRHDRG